MFDLPSLVLYIVIILTTVSFARYSQVCCVHPDVAIGSNRIVIKYNDSFLLIAFLIHWFFLVFTDIGTDRDEYISIIEDRAEIYFSYGIEVGFNGLCFLLYKLTQSADIVIFLIKTLTLIVFYLSFYKLRHSVNLGYAFFSFNTMAYFQGYYLLSMQLGIALVFLAYTYALYRDYVRAFLMVGVAVTVHSTALMMLPLFALSCFYSWKRNKINRKHILIQFIMVVIITLSFGVIMTAAISSIPMFEQYQKYDLSGKYDGSGLMIYLTSAILLYITYRVYNSRLDYNYINLTFIFVLYSICFATIGYKIDVFSRMNKYFFACINIVSLPLFVRYLEYQKKQYVFSKEKKSLGIVLISFYLALNGILTFMAQISITGPSDIGVYHLCNPFN